MLAMGNPGASSSSIASSWIYDVFLSFYGEDTRKGFIDHLHVALKRKGIITFRDDEKLEQGKYISQQLLKAIQKSQYAIVVISERYAFSKWCLIELTKILECKNENGMIVLPVFYYVNPSNVRKQEGSFAKAFAKHSLNSEVDEEQSKAWRTALKDVGNLVGWHIHDRHEAAIIEEISQQVLDGLNRTPSNIFEGLVGVGSQASELISLLSIGSEDVLFVGVCGMGGIGKTTLAKVIYDRVFSQFEASCFVASIKEETQNHGVVHLQMQLVCEILQESGLRLWNTYTGIDKIKRIVRNRNILIVLDDVDTEDQLKALAGSPTWFGRGSRVIVTSRDHHLLKRYVNKIYEVKELSMSESLKLFSWKAFKKDHPKENYMELSKDIMNYAQGLPLAIEVFGSYLFGRTVDEWKAAREQLKANLKPELLDKFQISFGGLEESQKRLFLDIACFFNGRCIFKDDHKLECLNDYLAIDIEVLKEKCLIKELYGQLRMHNLLKKMGQQIVYRECPSEPGKRSRLWQYEDIINVLKYNTGTDTVEAIDLNPLIHKREQLNFEALSKMKRLKMLVIRNDRSYHAFHTLEWYGDPLNFMLSNELRCLEWVGYPLENLPINFQANKLVVLEMPYSCIKQISGWKSFGNVKSIDMRFSRNLIEIPNFSEMHNLVELDLQHCTSLSKVHSSLGFLKRLKILDMEGCVHLNKFPCKISLESLEYLNLVGCSKLEKFPNIIGNMTSLKFLDLIGSGINEFPLSFKDLSSLTSLNLCSCLSYRTCFPFQWLGMALESVEKRFSRFYQSRTRRIPVLDVGGNGSQSISCLLPDIFTHFVSLKELDLSYRNLLDTDMPCKLSCSSIQFLNLSGSKLTTIPDCIFQLSDLHILYLRHSYSLQALPESLFSHLSHLKLLDLGYCNILDGMILDNFGYLCSLEALALSGNKLRRIPDLNQLYQLYKLYLDDCTELEALPKLPLSLADLDIGNCVSLKISWIKVDGGLSSDCAFLSVRICYDDRPYKIPQIPSYIRIASLSKPGSQLMQNFVAPALVCGIPDWFDRRITSSLGTVDSCLLHNTINQWSGLAMLILYKVEPDSSPRKGKKQKLNEGWNSNYGIFHGENPGLPHFLCHFQVNEVGIKESVLLSAPEVPSIGPNAFWVFIEYKWLFTHCKESCGEVYNAIRNACLKASIESCNLNVKVECGTRAVYWDDLLEMNKVISDISPPDFCKVSSYLHVYGLIDETKPKNLE